jgi:hypothetical protein
MPMCCRSNGGSGCNYNSNLDCDASDSHGCNTGSTGYTNRASLLVSRSDATHLLVTHGAPSFRGALVRMSAILLSRMPS